MDRQLDRWGNFEPPKSELGNRMFAIEQALVDDLTALIERKGQTEGTPRLLFTDSQGGTCATPAGGAASGNQR